MEFLPSYSLMFTMLPDLQFAFLRHGDNEVYDGRFEGVLKSIQEVINVSCDLVFQVQGWKIQPNSERVAEHHKSLYPNLKIKNTDLRLD